MPRIRRKLRAGLALVLILVAVVAATARPGAAQPQSREPGSCLLFPLYDTRDANSTLVTVTNTNTSREDCGGGRDAGDVLLHYVYFEGDARLQFDRYELLGPGDTLTVLADTHNPEGVEGYLLVSASFKDAGGPAFETSFDAIVGSAVVIDSLRERAFRYSPYVFQAVVEPADPCDRPRTDVDGDGAIDFDGLEYSRFPRELILDSFFEERGRFESELVLVSTVRSDDTAELDFSLINNEGAVVTGVLAMPSWWRGSLSDLSPVAGDLGGRVVLDNPGSVETGWLQIGGGRIVDRSGNPVLDAGGGIAIPPVLALFAELVAGTDLSSGRTLAHRGSLDGLELLSGDGDPQQNP